MNGRRKHSLAGGRSGDGLIAGAWLLLYAWRPFFFGLYHDDWNCALSSWGEKIRLFPSRPVLVCLAQGMALLCGTRPWAWQLSSAALVLCAALGLRALARRVFPGPQDGLAAGLGPADAAALVWLVFPWMLGCTAWSGGSISLFSQLFLCLGLVACLGALADGAGLAWGCAALAVSGLTYEAFLFMAPLLVAWCAVTREAGARRYWKRTLAAVCAVECAAVAFNRLAAAAPGAVTKKFNPAWLHLGFANLGALAVLPLRFGHAGKCMAACVLLAAAISIALARKKGAVRRLYFGLGFVVLGVADCAFLYAVANYPIEPKGLFARTTLGFSLWVALLWGAFIAQLGDGDGQGREKPWLAGALAVFVAAACIATLQESRDWRNAWVRQQAILAQAASLDLGPLRPGDVIVADLPRSGGWVPDFGAFWDISAALAAGFPALKALNAGPDGAPTLATVARPWEWKTAWSHGAVVQTQCVGGTLWALPAKRAWLWRPSEHLFRPMVQGEALGCP